MMIHKCMTMYIYHMEGWLAPCIAITAYNIIYPSNKAIKQYGQEGLNATVLPTHTIRENK